MRRPTQSSLSLYIWLLSSAVAACSGAGAGQDGLVTVGVRPTSDRDAAPGGGPIVLPSGSDVTDESPDENSSPAQNVAPVATPEVSAGTFARGPVAGTRSAPTEVTDATLAGAGGAGIGAAGSLAERSASEDECGAIPSQPAGNVSAGLVNGAGLIEYDVKASNVFTSLRTTLVVPATPEPTGPVYVWPGIQPAPSGSSFQPIGNGALMSVLSWGVVCSADVPGGYSNWWVAPMYSNLSSADPQYSGCHSGKVAPVEPTQFVDIDIHLEGATWIQKMVNRSTGEASELSLDLKGQEQGRAFFAIAPQTANKPTEDIVFTHSVLSMEDADPDACEPMMRGTNDFASKPRVSADGKHCCIDRIVLRAARVTPTTTDPP